MIINLMKTKIRKNLEHNQKKETLGSQIKIMDPEFISSHRHTKTPPGSIRCSGNNVDYGEACMYLVEFNRLCSWKAAFSDPETLSIVLPRFWKGFLGGAVVKESTC